MVCHILYGKSSKSQTSQPNRSKTTQPRKFFVSPIQAWVDEHAKRRRQLTILASVEVDVAEPERPASDVPTDAEGRHGRHLAEEGVQLPLRHTIIEVADV